jgi:hypothetical protein
VEKIHLFHIALQVKSARTRERWTAKRFADAHGVSTTFLYMVLSGEGTSERLEREIDALMRENLPVLRRHLSSFALAA